MAAPANTNEDTHSQVQIRLTTRSYKYKVPDAPILVPAKLRRYGLSEVVNHLLELDKPIPFDFVIDGQFLRSSLENYLTEKALSTENILTIEYIESILPPSKLASFPHDDWVSAIDAKNSSEIITGCYDNIVRTWNLSGECVSTMKGHTGPIKSVSRVGNSDMIVSGSLDMTLRAWRGEKCLYECIGHEAGISSVDTTKDLIASSSQDSSIIIWSTNENDIKESSDILTRGVKRSKGKSIIPQKVPIQVLLGHVGIISGVVFDRKIPQHAYSGGWDHSVRTWDMENGTNIVTRNAGDEKGAVLSIAAAENMSALVASGHSDRSIGIWDMRVNNDSSVIKLSLSGHNGVVTSLNWNSNSTGDILCSGSHDGTLKIWDTRSRTPLYSIKRSEERVGIKLDSVKILSVAWSSDGEFLASGGDDSRLEIEKVSKYDSR